MTRPPDFAALFDASPYPYLLIDCDMIIIGANPAYLHATGRQADIIGQHIFEAFPADPTDPESTNLAEVSRAIKQAIATKLPHTSAFLRYAIPRQSSGGTGFEPRFWSAVHSPVLGADGEVAYVAQNAIDVTDLYVFDHAAGLALVEPGAAGPAATEMPDRAQLHEALKRILHDERSHLSGLFNQAPGFMAILNGQYHVVDMVNEAFYQLVGHRDMIGKPILEALPELASQGFGDTLDAVYKSGKAQVAHARRLTIQRVPNARLADRYIDLVYQPLFAAGGQVSGMFVQGHDVTASVAARAAQRDADERLREGMVAARMVVWDLDLASQRMRYSDNAVAVLGAVLAEGDALWSHIEASDLARLDAAREQAIIACGSYHEVVRVPRSDGSGTLWLSVKGSVRCDADGLPTALRGVLVDVSDRMRAEDELREANRRKDEFLAMLAHELRNPLAPISAAAQVLRMPALKPELIRRTSEVISRQVGHMTSLIDDLLDVSRVTRGLIGLECKRLGVMDIVADALEQARPLVDSRKQQLTVHLPTDSVALVGDQKRLVQVLTNLLNNASKFSAQGGRLVLNVSTDGDDLCISVGDNGIGISAQLLPQVFDLFTQAVRTPDRSQGGLGLGLSLVRSLVALHGGTVSASSPGEGQGAVFSIRLPRLPDSEAEARPPAPVRAPCRAKGLRLLVVDDNTDAAEMLGTIMASAGHQVAIEYEPYQAIERARRDCPDVCLLDIGLPGMDGNQLARCLRLMPQTSNATLIAVTGYGKQFDRDASLAAGFDYYFVKPADPNALVALLDQIDQL